jgi:hypothetical protein
MPDRRCLSARMGDGQSRRPRLPRRSPRPKRLKVGDLKSKEGIIIADIVTVDNLLVQRLKVTGMPVSGGPRRSTTPTVTSSCLLACRRNRGEHRCILRERCAASR